MTSSPTLLERLLALATHDAGVRPEFYRRLLESEVLVPVLHGPVETGKVPAGEVLLVKCLDRLDGVQVIPFFTSAQAVFDASPAGERCVVMGVRELFESKRASHFHLNPASTFGRAFLPMEIDLLLRTAGVGEITCTELSNDEPLAMAVPTGDHSAMIHVLCTLYARHVAVCAAFLVEVRNASAPSLLIAIEATTAIEEISRDTASVVQDFGEELAVPVDIVQIDRDGSDFARHIVEAFAPFYQRGLAASLLEGAALYQSGLASDSRGRRRPR